MQPLFAHDSFIRVPTSASRQEEADSGRAGRIILAKYRLVSRSKFSNHRHSSPTSALCDRGRGPKARALSLYFQIHWVSIIIAPTWFIWLLRWLGSLKVFPCSEVFAWSSADGCHTTSRFWTFVKCLSFCSGYGNEMVCVGEETAYWSTWQLSSSELFASMLFLWCLRPNSYFTPPGEP